LIYVAVGTGAILVLRSMRRGWAATDSWRSFDVPYGPVEPEQDR
jgi:hypothetical protein